MSTHPAQLRPVRDSDDLDAINAQNTTWSGSTLIRRLLSDNGPGVRVWLIADVDGRVAGYVHGLFSTTDPANAEARSLLWVTPEFRGREIGEQLWTATMEPLARAGARRISGWADESESGGRDWLKAHGFAEHAQYAQSELELASLYPASDGIPDGLSIATLPANASEAMWHEFHEVFVPMTLDRPGIQEDEGLMPYEFLRLYLSETWQVCIARDREGRIVGGTAVFIRNSATRTVNTMFTGVAPDWRGKGVATALKREHARHLAAAGWRSILTQNMVGNEPILAANRRLGFRPTKTMIEIVYAVPANDWA